jgi:hypothetical protein
MPVMAGLGTLADIEHGHFDKLGARPALWRSLALRTYFGLTYSGNRTAIALRTGSAQVA